MKKVFKVLTAAAALAAATSMAAPQYAFKSYTYPHGNIIKYGDDAMIKDHFNKWKAAWYDKSKGWVLAPEGTCSTVSEAIAYGMLIMVYMDDGTNGAKEDFDKLYSTWKTNGGNGAGMNWRVGCDAGTGSASDADFDAALALIMASKQWNDASYLNDAKTIMTWMLSNDISGGHIKPGSGWNDMFNPSYATLASFEVFKSIDAGWGTVLTTAAADLKKSQNSTSGLVADWHDWNSFSAVKNEKAAVAQPYVGFYDDAARTPWRTAWAYYWFGNSDAKAFNDKIVKWLYPETHNVASNINSGYSHEGKAQTTSDRNFASSTFSGGLGLAAASDETDAGMSYIESVYGYLKTKTSCATAQGCGESVSGEKYYPSTLNLLYLLLMTGHMPNFYAMDGYTEFTPDPSLAPSLGSSDGEQMALKDSTVGISGFWNWGAYHDKYNIGTVMSVDSGTSPLFYKADLDMVVAEASMEIGPEPEWTQAAADAGTLKYPSAGIAMSFLSNSKKGVDLAALGVASVRITAKVSGPIRMAVLSEATKEAGAEPGVYLEASADYAAQTYDLTPEDYGFKGFTKKGDKDAMYGGILSWVDMNTAPLGTEIIKCVTGLKFELKQSSGGLGNVSIKSIEFLDASGNVIDPVSITGMEGVATKPAGSATQDPGTSDPTSSASSDPTPGSSATTVDPTPGSSATPGAIIPSFVKASKFQASANGLNIQISNASVGADFAVFSVQGKVLKSGKVMNSTERVSVQSKGAYLVRVGSEVRMINVK